ncbi:M48 family metallopeptidase [Patescibacteria group bacterium]|nr:M48 family metallopeptidase [Patescibacteria group bacterium]
MVIYMLLTLAVGWLISWYFSSDIILIFFAILVIIQGGISYWYADSIALGLARAELLSQKQYPQVYRTVQNLTITAGLPMPRLFLINDTAMNAFATGRDPRHAALALTQGLIDKLDDNELSGVIAHEMSHVGNEDIRLMSMVMVMGGLIALLSDFFLRSLWWGGERRRDDNGNSGLLMIIALILALLAPLAATLIQLAISRKREFMADASGVLLTRYPEGLISALTKIGGDREPLEVANKATAHMYFKNPLPEGWLSNLFSTHPPIAERIAALQKGSGLSTSR